MKNDLGFKIGNLVNNLKNNDVSNRLKNFKHTISNNDYCFKAKNFYKTHQKLMLSLAEENINTIVDLKYYENWILYDKWS